MLKKEIKKSTRDAYGEELLSLAKKDKKIIVVSADLPESTRIHHFAQKFPQRFIECGVAEQNALGIANGLALAGKTAYMSSFAVFSPGRNWDQLRVSVCYSNTNVKIVSTHSGLAVGEDGASHQALEDIAITRCLPNLIVIAPVDYLETKKALQAINKIKGPVYLRLTRNKTNIITNTKTPFKIGQANIIKKGKDITIVACGPIMNEVLLAAKELRKKKISLEIINNHTIKPLDKKTILNSIKKTKRLMTVEDHQRHGGMGSAIIEMMAQNYPVPTKIIGVNDTFGESGTPEQLYKKYHLNYKDIIKEILKLLKK